MSQVILFDLDGTLTESGEGIMKSVQYALEKLGIIEENQENLRRFIGPPLLESFMNYYGMDQETAAQAVVYYRERYTDKGIFENELYPKIPQLLEILQINDKILGVASSKPEVYVKQILEHFGIDQYFQVIVGSELDGSRTKKPEVIEEALRRLNMQTERDKVLMVGDREHDVSGAISCGLQCIGVAYGYGSREELEKAGAVYVADTVEDLGILASPNDEETTEHVESVRKDRLGHREKKLHGRKKGKEKSGPDDRQREVQPEELTGEVQEVEYKMHPVRRIWQVIYPILIHQGITILCSMIFAIYFVWDAMKNGDFMDAVGKTMGTSLYQLLVSSVAASVILYFFYRGDQRKRKAGIRGQKMPHVWNPPIIWFSVVILAMAGCQLLNDLIDISGLNELFPAYSNLSDNLVAGQPVWLQFLTIGILAPIAEELVFRGLIFARLKEWMKPWLAMILSALIFGAYHGNIVQFVYAFFMGLILALIYYRTGTLFTCIAAHVVANLWSLFGYTWMSRWIHGLPLGVLVGIIIELLLCVIPGYWLVADRRKKKANNTES